MLYTAAAKESALPIGSIAMEHHDDPQLTLSCRPAGLSIPGAGLGCCAIIPVSLGLFQAGAEGGARGPSAPGGARGRNARGRCQVVLTTGIGVHG